MMRKKELVMVLVALCVSVSLPALDLSEIVDTSKKNSPLMQSYILQRDNSALSITKSDLGKQFQIQAGGGLTWTGRQDGPVTDTLYTISATPDVSVILPNEGDTTLRFSLGDSGARIERQEAGGTTANTYSMTPTLTASHTFNFGKTDDDKSDFLILQSTLLKDSSFISNELAFESDVYTKLIAILEAQKSLISIERQIESTEQAIENALKLGAMTKDSVSYKGQELTLLTLKNTRTATLSRLELAKEQYRVATGLVYDNVKNIPLPKLDFTPLTGGNTSVLLKQVAWQIAQEDYELEKTKTETSKLVLNGTGGVRVSKKDNEQTTYAGGQVFAGATLTQNNFSVYGQAGVSNLGTGTSATPTVTIGGTWRNQVTAESDQITLKQLENKVLIAQLDYNDAITSYTITAGNLQNSIASWKDKDAQIQIQSDYNLKSLDYSRNLLAVGLGTQDAVADAEILVRQDEYDQAISLLNGLVLENQIKTMLI
ncbi:hypothetical protein Spico_1357 [Parasphaerochaeta coccoides DSM 17374]|uniref:Outer membrane efflux protein n=2 Tax=Parasphaerochaeta TaxID=3062336 RepID=F4GHH4_PARC1|nr:hypothetical protein Spico_1357 [Parasphaerochaeta coccoides DSM 17374]